jgi:hypothetical protein
MLRNFLFGLSLLTLLSCGVYSFTGGNTGDAKTIQIDFFPNVAPLVDPGLSQEFTLALQDLFVRQTNLNLIQSGGDLQFEGEIVEYRIMPMSATAEQTAAQNRLTIGVNVRFYNNLIPEDNFEQKFSFYYDYGADVQIESVKSQAYEEIFDRITQDIFNASVAKW